MRNKITIIGAGNVGATTALYCAIKELGDIVLIDIIEGMPEGIALDMSQVSSMLNFDVKITGSNDMCDMKGSDIVVITAGLPRKPGMDRLDLLKKNADIVTNICENIKKYAPNSIVIVVTNPVDTLTYLTMKLTELPAKHVIGKAGVLDSARFAYFIAEELNISIRDVSPMVLGGHGDSMLPIPRLTTVNGIPITDLLPKDKITAICERTKAGGAEIVKLLKKGSAYYAPGAATATMITAILFDQRRILPCSVYVDGQYGLSDLYIGLMTTVGMKGVEKIHEIKLTDEELKELHQSAEVYKKSIKDLGY